MNERRKNPPVPVQPTEKDLARARYIELRNQEWNLNAIVAEPKPVVDGQLDFNQYDTAMKTLRVVRAEMASLLWSQQ